MLLSVFYLRLDYKSEESIEPSEAKTENLMENKIEKEQPKNISIKEENTFKTPVEIDKQEISGKNEPYV
jgi:hypothetical protein